MPLTKRRELPHWNRKMLHLPDVEAAWKLSGGEV